MATNPKDFEKLRAKIIARAWKDPRFKEKLLKNPKAAFAEMGLDLPENVQLKVVEDQTNSVTFVLPPVPSSAKSQELSDQELAKLAAGQAETLISLLLIFLCGSD